LSLRGAADGCYGKRRDIARPAQHDELAPWEDKTFSGVLPSYRSVGNPLAHREIA
jgi:hypothetical protein